MAGLKTLHSYDSGSYIERMDMRCKLLLFVFLNITSLNTGMAGLIVLSGLIGGLFLHLHISLLSAFIEIKFILILLLFVFFSRSVSLPGKVIFELGWISISMEGLYSGVIFGWRLLTVVLLAMVLMRTSSTMEIKSAIQWYFRPVPAIPEKKVAIMLSLMIRFLPMIIDQAREVGYAQKSRGVENRKNPMVRISTFTIPLITRIFKSADELAFAMESRCYSENRTDPELHARKQDFFVLIVGIGLCCTITLL